MSRRLINTSFLVVLAVSFQSLTYPYVFADTIYVKADGTGDYPTIQAAVNASRNGDIVLVADGIYTGNGNRDIDYKGKAITVRSENGPENCIIDCQATSSDPHRGFYFNNSEDRKSIVDGFTIKNGFQDGSGWLNVTGAGIICWQTSPTIKNCVISQCSAWGGAAIYCSNWNNPNVGSSITNCVIKNNTSGAIGAIGFKDSTAVISDCEIIDNISSSGGIDFERTNIVIENCYIARNDGVGIHCSNDSCPVISNCVISNNRTDYYGGGFRFVDCDQSPGPKLINCLISGNTAGQEGGGIGLANSNILTILNCTIVGNSAEITGGGIFARDDVFVSNSILWNNTPNQAEGNIPIEYSNIQGGWSGEGNINTDPLFVNLGGGDYHLLSGSPCIDVGDPNFIMEPGMTDIDGQPRVMGIRVDMGADEFFVNTPPVADAGADQTVYVCADGMTEVKLDGSGSFDADGDELTYLWSWIVDSNEMTATGVDPNILLGIGEHTIELIVNDGLVDSEPNAVIITVIAPIEADVHIVPRTINRQNRMKRIMAIIRLPEGIGKHDIADEPFVLDPGGIEAIWDRVIGRGNQATVFALFDKDEVMDALPNNGRVELTVTGKLESGQCIYGTDTVRIVQPLRQRWRSRIRR